jgi:hypothetical protein
MFRLRSLQQSIRRNPRKSPEQYLGPAAFHSMAKPAAGAIKNLLSANLILLAAC